MTRWLLVALLLIGGAAVARAEDAPLAQRTRSGEATADQQDLLLLAPQRPLVVRLFIVVDRVPFRRLWQERIERAFAEMDADGDGQLTADEAQRLFTAVLPAAASAPLATSEGAPITLATVIGHCQRHARALKVREAPGVSGTAIFSILDADGDRRLSLAELQGAEAILRRRDFNDDEVITADELLEDPRARATSASTSSGALVTAGAVLALDADTTREDIVAALREHYDRDRDGRLCTTGRDAEVALDRTIVSELTKDGAGTISLAALADHCRAHVDLEVHLALGTGASGVSGAQAERGTDEFTIHRRLSRDLKIAGRGVEIDLRRNNRNPARNAEQDYDFASFDGDGNGYLDEAEGAQATPLAGAFAVADANGDGRLFQAEFEAYLRGQAQGASTRLLLKVVDRGQDLFNLLDELPDNQLSMREILAAPRLLVTQDRDGDGYLGGEEIPLRLDWELGRASAEIADRGSSVRIAMPAQKNSEQHPAPKWFLAMDRNQDGDVSVREFLNSAAAFAKMDANHDGLIDAAEATAAEK